MRNLGWGWTANPPRGVRKGEAFADGVEVHVMETGSTYSIVARCSTKAMAADMARMLNRKRWRTRRGKR